MSYMGVERTDSERRQVSCRGGRNIFSYCRRNLCIVDFRIVNRFTLWYNNGKKYISVSRPRLIFPFVGGQMDDKIIYF